MACQQHNDAENLPRGYISTANGSMMRFDRKPLFLLLSSFGCRGNQTCITQHYFQQQPDKTATATTDIHHLSKCTVTQGSK